MHTAYSGALSPEKIVPGRHMYYVSLKPRFDRIYKRVSLHTWIDPEPKNKTRHSVTSPALYIAIWKHVPRSGPNWSQEYQWLATPCTYSTPHHINVTKQIQQFTALVPTYIARWKSHRCPTAARNHTSNNRIMCPQEKKKNMRTPPLSQRSHQSSPPHAWCNLTGKNSVNRLWNQLLLLAAVEIQNQGWHGRELEHKMLFSW